MIGKVCSPLMIFLVLVVTAGCASHDDHEHDHSHDHAHDHADEVPRGRNGGRLLTEGSYAIEVLLDERDGKRFVVWLYENDAPVAAARSTVRLVTERLGGERRNFDFDSQVTRWRSKDEVAEPHSFDIEIDAQIDGQTIRVSYPSYEGRTVIDAKAAAAAGIVSAPVSAGNLAESLPASGTLRPEPSAQAQVVARFAGVLKTLEVKAGDRVSRGQKLATVDSNLSLSTYPLTAPITGVVEHVHVDLGASVDGNIVMTIVDPQQYFAEVLLYGVDASRVRLGAEVSVENLADRTRAAGQVSRLTPTFDTATQSVMAQIRLSEKRDQWRPGAAIRASITLKDEMAQLRVPRTAVQTYAGETVVFVREGNIFEARPIRLGRQNRDYFEVLAGLEIGQEIVVEQSFLIKADIEKSAVAHDH